MWGRCMGLLLWVYSLNKFWAFFLLHCIQCWVIFDRDISIVCCTTQNHALWMITFAASHNYNKLYTLFPRFFNADINHHILWVSSSLKVDLFRQYNCHGIDWRKGISRQKVCLVSMTSLHKYPISDCNWRHASSELASKCSNGQRNGPS